MADIKVEQEELLLGFLEVFRNVGYDGANLETLAQATGLRKSSLYHRFPGGKKEMAEEVLKYSGQWVNNHIVTSLRASGDPVKRLDKVLSNIDELYSGGENACILRALSTESGLNLFSELINGTFRDLIKGFAKIIEDFGRSSEQSETLAEDVVIQIQGSLVLSRSMKDTSIFKRTLNNIEKMVKGGG